MFTHFSIWPRTDARADSPKTEGLRSASSASVGGISSSKVHCVVTRLRQTETERVQCSAMQQTQVLISLLCAHLQLQFHASDTTSSRPRVRVIGCVRFAKFKTFWWQSRHLKITIIFLGTRLNSFTVISYHRVCGSFVDKGEDSLQHEKSGGKGR